MFEQFDYLSTVSGGGYIGSWLSAWIYRQGCDLRFKVASDRNSKVDIIDQFRMEFESKRKQCAVLIVREKSNSNKWTLAGFNDAGEFLDDIEIDNHSDDLWKELDKDPRDKSRVAELATLRLGRTLPRGKKGKGGINVVTQNSVTRVLLPGLNQRPNLSSFYVSTAILLRLRLVFLQPILGFCCYLFT